MREGVPSWVWFLLALAMALSASVFIIRLAGDGVARVDCAPEIVEIVVPESDRANFTY